MKGLLKASGLSLLPGFYPELAKNQFGFGHSGDKQFLGEFDIILGLFMVKSQRDGIVLVSEKVTVTITRHTMEAGKPGLFLTHLGNVNEKGWLRWIKEVFPGVLVFEDLKSSSRGAPRMLAKGLIRE